MKNGSIKQLSIGRKDLFLLAPDMIKEDPGWNVRNDNDELHAHIRSLADSIKEIGVQQPLTVFMKGEEAIVTDGHCRLLAVKLAISEGSEIKSIPVRTEERYSNEADRVLSMLTRNSGRQLTIPEQAEVVKRLLSFGWSAAEVSRKTGSSRQHINNLINYLSSPAEIQQMVKSGVVSATLALDQVKKEGQAAVNTIADAVKKANSKGKKKATSKHIPKPPPAQSPTDNQILDACMYFRHDYGLMVGAEKEKLWSEAKLWFEAWKKATR